MAILYTKTYNGQVFNITDDIECSYKENYANADKTLYTIEASGVAQGINTYWGDPFTFEMANPYIVQIEGTAIGSDYPFTKALYFDTSDHTGAGTGPANTLALYITGNNIRNTISTVNRRLYLPDTSTWNITYSSDLQCSFSTNIPIFETKEEADAYCAEESESERQRMIKELAVNYKKPDVIDQVDVNDTLYDLGATARNISFNNSKTDLTSTNVQNAIVEVDSKIDNLATVATSGDYDDLINKPSIPANTSDLNNDAGFIDSSVNTLTNYYTKTQTDGKYMVKDVDYVTAGKKDGSTLGSNATAEGQSVVASGGQSHAEGMSTSATSWQAHAEGYGTCASGSYSHAEGNSTVASGMYAHSEGSFTKAIYSSAHAEGNYAVSSGTASHAEGHETSALGEFSHAEGRHSLASKENTHAEGYYTTASGASSHAEGYLTSAAGDRSHAEGYATTAIGNESHVEGSLSTSIGLASHAEGRSQSIGDFSHSEGNSTYAVGHYSHAEGDSSKAINNNAHAEGSSTYANGSSSHAEGSSTYANGSSSHAEGSGTYAGGLYSHAEGYKTSAISDYQHVEGKYNIADSDMAHIIGNGTSTQRSNAFTVSWNGDITAGRSNGLTLDNKLPTGEDVHNYIKALITPTNATITDGIAQFTTIEANPLKSLKADITPIQDLSHGGPSPTNICPIYGHTQEVITDTDGDETTETYTIDLNGTRYGGTLDVTEGELTDTRYMYEPTEVIQAAVSSQTDTVVVFDLTLSMNNLPSPKANTLISNRFSMDIPSGQAGRCVLSATHMYLVIAKSELNTYDRAGLNEWITNNPTQLCYELATPTTVTLTPTQITALLGENNVSASTGAVSECKYTKMHTWDDIKAYIDSQMGE